LTSFDAGRSVMVFLPAATCDSARGACPFAQKIDGQH
jgi:hypothetical protein